MRLHVIAVLIPTIWLSFAYRGNSDDSEKSKLYYDTDKIHRWRSEEDKAFSESSVCGSENLSYVATCTSDKTVENLLALKQTQCFCDRDCHKYGDCCLDILSEGYYHSLPWKCREVREGTNLKVPIYVLQQCPGDWEDDYVRTMCEEEAMDLEKSGQSFSYLQDIPVKSKLNGLFYRNVYCALCNRDNYLDNWNSMIFCQGMPNVVYSGNVEDNFNFSQSFYNTRTQNFRNVIVEGQKRNCRLVIHDFNLSSLIHTHNARLCKPVVDTCDEKADVTSWRKCNSYTSFVYENGYPNKKRTVYKNFHCALCNKADVRKLMCIDPLYPPLQSTPSSGAALNFLFDFNFGGDNNQVGITRPCKLSEGLVWDHILKKCYNFTCGSLFIRKGSECIPRVSDDSRQDGLNNSCLKRTLTGDEFVMQKNSSVYIKRTNRLLLLNEYEINEKNGDDVISINVCVEEGSYLLHLSQVQYWLSEVTLSLSIICLMFHLIAYSVLKELRNCPGKVLMSLSACMICGHMFLLTGQHIAEYYWICYVSGVLTHFGYLSSFLWMNVMAYDIYRTFSLTQSRNSNNRKTFIKYSLYCWVTASFITSFSVFLDNVLNPENEFRPKYGDPICWFNQRKGLFIFFILPIFILLVKNVIFFVSTALRIRKISKETKMVKNFSDKIRYLLYIKLTVVFGLTWLLGILAGLLRVSFLWYPFIILNGLQGVFIFVAFTLKRKIIKMLVIKFRLNSDSYTMGKESAIRRAIYSSLSNLSTLQTTATSQLPDYQSGELLKAVRKINPDTAL